MSKKYYVIWRGVKTGVFSSWPEVQSYTQGRADAQFMGFTSQQAAELAFQSTYTRALMKRSMDKDQGSQKTSAPGEKKRASSSQTKASEISTQAEIKIYCDGACSPNPGKSGTGVALYHQTELKELWYGLYEANGTNNTAELNGLLAAFQLAKVYIAQGSQVEILSDSKYSIDSITKWASGWQRKGWKKANGEAIKNPELIKQCFSLYQEIKAKIAISHVKGHANIEGNELSDRMAVLARSQHQTGFVRYQQSLNIAEILAMPSG